MAHLLLAGLRNLAGLTGMTLATATLAGATRGWMTALPYVLLTLLLGTHGSSTTGGHVDHPWWAFVLEASSSATAAVSATLLLLVSTTAHVRFGTRAEQ